MPRPLDKNVGSKCIFNIKSDGTVVQFNERLVAIGFNQLHDLDYDETLA